MTLLLLSTSSLAQEALPVLVLPSELSAQLSQLDQVARIFDTRQIDPKHHEPLEAELKKNGIPHFEHGAFIVAGNPTALSSLKDILIQAENYTDPEVYEAFWNFVGFAADRKIGFRYRHSLGVLASYSASFNRIYISRAADMSPAVLVHEIAHAYHSEIISELVRLSREGEIPLIHELFGGDPYTGAEFLQIIDESLAWILTSEFRTLESDAEYSWIEIGSRLRRMSYAQRFGRQNIEEFYSSWQPSMITSTDLKALVIERIKVYKDLSYEQLAELGESSVENSDANAQWNFVKTFLFMLGQGKVESSADFFRCTRIARGLSVFGESGLIKAAALDLLDAFDSTLDSSVSETQLDKRRSDLAFDSKRWAKREWSEHLWKAQLLTFSDRLIGFLFYMHEENSVDPRRSMQSYNDRFGVRLRLGETDLELLAQIQAQEGLTIAQKITGWLNIQKSRDINSLFEELFDKPSELVQVLICRDHAHELTARHIQQLFGLIGLDASTAGDFALKIILELFESYDIKPMLFVTGEITEDIDARADAPIFAEIDFALAELLQQSSLNSSESRLLADVFSRFLPIELPVFRESLIQVLRRGDHSAQARSQLVVYLFGFSDELHLGGARWATLAKRAIQAEALPPEESLLGIADFHRIYTPSLLKTTHDLHARERLLSEAVRDLEELIQNPQPKVARYAYFAAFSHPEYAGTSPLIRELLSSSGFQTSKGSRRCEGVFEEAAAAKPLVKRP
jgi:hypothetical protein